MEAVYLGGMGLPRQEVARLLGVTEGTVRSYLADYREAGMEGLYRFNPHPQSCGLRTVYHDHPGSLYHRSAAYHAGSSQPD